MVNGQYKPEARSAVLLLVWLTGFFFPVFMYVIDRLLLDETLRYGESIFLLALIHLLALALCSVAVTLSRFRGTYKIALMLLSLMALGFVCLVIGYYDLSTHTT